MTSTQHDHDGSFYDMVHTLLQQQCPAHRERRGGQRLAFDCVQLLAPYDGVNLPMPTDFRLVRCLDISPTGFAFVSDEPPPHPFVVIALGAVPFKFFSARVVHVNTADQTNAGECRVGCQLLHRIVK